MDVGKGLRFAGDVNELFTFVNSIHLQLRDICNWLGVRALFCESAGVGRLLAFAGMIALASAGWQWCCKLPGWVLRGQDFGCGVFVLSGVSAVAGQSAG